MAAHVPSVGVCTVDGAVVASGELLLASGTGVWRGFGVSMMHEIWVQLGDL